MPPDHSLPSSDDTTLAAIEWIKKLEAERNVYRAALERIERVCADDRNEDDEAADEAWRIACVALEAHRAEAGRA